MTTPEQNQWIAQATHYKEGLKANEFGFGSGPLRAFYAVGQVGLEMALPLSLELEVAGIEMKTGAIR
jgi:hypothetical protein